MIRVSSRNFDLGEGKHSSYQLHDSNPAPGASMPPLPVYRLCMYCIMGGGSMGGGVGGWGGWGGVGGVGGGGLA